jgi:hypothetical protein
VIIGSLLSISLINISLILQLKQKLCTNFMPIWFMKISWAFLEGSFVKFLNENLDPGLISPALHGSDSVVTYLLTVTTSPQMANPWLQLEQEKKLRTLAPI